MRLDTTTVYKLFIFFTICFTCCKKEKERLNELRDTDQQVISTCEIAQSVLDNTTFMRETPALTELSADDYNLPQDFNSFPTPLEFNTYIWNTEIFQGQSLAGDWFYPYQQIYYANSVLAAMPVLARSGTQAELDQVQGMALFIRAYAYYNLVIEFASLYDDQAGSNPGIPILLTPERIGNLTRASVKETYGRIQKDLEDALPLLPDIVEPIKKNRPSKPAVYALLARIYLSMGNYIQAKQYADASLQRYATLIDYNNISLTAPVPFSISNEEVLYQTNLLSSISTFLLNDFYVDSTLYRSYGSTDLRKELYFYLNASGLPVSRSSYTGSILRFSGLATDEVYLIRAECQARASNVKEALDDLNHLLSKRYKSAHFTPLSAGSAKEALDLVLKERRKELIYRGLRWTDIRRLNKENYNINLKRTVKGKEYILPAGDNRFVLPIPPDVISSNRDMIQNPR